MPDTGEILQRLYDSEIHVALGWCWDGGIDAWLLPPFAVVGQAADAADRTVAGAVVKLADAAAKKCPQSTFAKWWAEQPR